jgi:hypothetical protein
LNKTREKRRVDTPMDGSDIDFGRVPFWPLLAIFRPFLASSWPLLATFGHFGKLGKFAPVLPKRLGTPSQEFPFFIWSAGIYSRFSSAAKRLLDRRLWRVAWERAFGGSQPCGERPRARKRGWLWAALSHSTRVFVLRNRARRRRRARSPWPGAVFACSPGLRALAIARAQNRIVKQRVASPFSRAALFEPARWRDDLLF